MITEVKNRQLVYPRGYAIHFHDYFRECKPKDRHALTNKPSKFIQICRILQLVCIDWAHRHNLDLHGYFTEQNICYKMLCSPIIPNTPPYSTYGAFTYMMMLMMMVSECFMGEYGLKICQSHYKSFGWPNEEIRIPPLVVFFTPPIPMISRSPSCHPGTWRRPLRQDMPKNSTKQLPPWYKRSGASGHEWSTSEWVWTIPVSRSSCS